MYLKNCTEKHLPEILAIFNETIANSTALYDYEPRTMEKVRAWYEERVAKQIAVIGAFDADDTLLGFATYGSFRPHDGYKFTVEHSVYVRADKRGNGLGKTLLAELIAEAKRSDSVHSLVAVIDTENTASIALHEKFGFTFCGEIRQCGFKFGRWLDIVFYQKILNNEH
jgi:phosphinothricin acetyltransferase